MTMLYRAHRSFCAAWSGAGMRWFSSMALFVLGAGLALAATRELGFSRSVTPGLIERYSGRFGRAARDHIGGWQTFVHGQTVRQVADGDLRFLDTVNAFFNRVPYVSDLDHWHVDDYWASPAEMIASDGADCEDFSIAKYFALKELGVPIQRLRMTYVKAARLDQAHMVLAYYPTPDGVPLILDNMEDNVELATERRDLVPVFSFNDEDALLVRQNQPAIKAGSALQIRQWSALIGKLEAELRY